MNCRSFVTLFLILATAVGGVAHAAPPVEDVETVLTGRCLADYRSKYEKLSKRRAFAVASDEDGRQACGWHRNEMFDGPPTYDALNACQKVRAKRNIQNECVVVSIDFNVVVEQGVLPELQDTGYDFPVDEDYIELHDNAMAVLEGRACQRSFRRYMLFGGFKAFAYTVSERGFYSICTFYSNPAPDLAQQQALDKCNEKRTASTNASKLAPECKIFAQNNQILLSRSDYGMGPFEHDSLTSARRLHLNTIKDYVEGGEDINQVDQRGRTALFYSVETNRLDVVKFLVNKGADFNLADNSGNTPLNVAKKRNYKDIAGFLEYKGALETVPAESENNSSGDDSLQLSDLRPVVPTMALDTELTKEHIDQFLNIMPTTAKVLSSLQNKLASNKEINKMVKAAMPKGEMFRTVASVASGLDEIAGLEAEVKKAGFESVGDWAFIGDRITSVFMVGEMMSAIASISYGDEGFVDGTNVFEFIDDESNPVEIRTRLQTELEASCAKSCVVPADLSVVSPHVGDVAAAFKGL